MKLPSFLAIFFLGATLVGAQTNRSFIKERKFSGERCRCASLIVELSSINTRLIRGKVGPDAVTPIVIEIYAVPPKMWKKDSYLITKEIKARRVSRTDLNGNYFLPSLKTGRYVIKFGTTDGGMNCSYIKVRLSRRYSLKNINTELSVGI